MIRTRKAVDRGHADHGWLRSHHSFSFADYYDPEFMGFRSLRVINEDRVKPGVGFGTHGHRDMEIISYVLDGALEHKDSMGNGSVIRPGDVQRMSAGTGVMHSEKNPSETDPVHFLQIWIMPEKGGIRPSYEQKRFEDDARQGKLTLVASRDGRDGSVMLHQDVRLYSTILRDNEAVTHEFGPDRYGWVQVARGTAEVNGQKLEAGDGASIAGERAITLRGSGEVLLFDLN